MVYISIHAPQWGATPGSKPSVLSVIYFNPRTPVGCDYDHVRPVGGLHISIHAPQWGATRSPQGEVVRISDISIHAPQWGATQHTLLRCHHTIDFNPRTPVGCDERVLVFDRRLRLFQSTHPSGVRRVPFRVAIERIVFQSTHPSGVRPAAVSSSIGSSHFNPRTPVGCDRSASAYSVGDIKFQSTHPSGVRRRASTGSPDGQANFNPRTPVGCDLQLEVDGALVIGISIHAPQWGATIPHVAHRLQHVISIHAPQWGATGDNPKTAKRPRYFNPRTPVGCDCCHCCRAHSTS